MYRVHKKTDDTSGLTTAWMQQRMILRGQDKDVNPRDDVINNISGHIRRDISSNKSAILMGDFNEAVDSREKTHEKMTKLGLVNIMSNRIPGNLL